MLRFTRSRRNGSGKRVKERMRKGTGMLQGKELVGQFVPSPPGLMQDCSLQSILRQLFSSAAPMVGEFPKSGQIGNVLSRIQRILNCDWKGEENTFFRAFQQRVCPVGEASRVCGRNRQVLLEKQSGLCTARVFCSHCSCWARRKAFAFLRTQSEGLSLSLS